MTIICSSNFWGSDILLMFLVSHYPHSCPSKVRFWGFFSSQQSYMTAAMSAQHALIPRYSRSFHWWAPIGAEAISWNLGLGLRHFCLGTSLAVQWLRFRLPMQGVQV